MSRALIMTAHALQAMLDRDVTPRDVEAAVANAAQRWTTDRVTTHQWRDIAVVTAERSAGTTVVTVLYRTGEQWTSEQGRPSGRRMSKQTRRRVQAMLRAAQAGERGSRGSAAA